jgi:predicted peptidase
VIAAPQCPAGEYWNPAQLGLLLDDLEAKYRIDRERIYVTGLSMGGYGTWALALRYPGRFAAIAPICGGGDPADAARIRDVPTWVFHGAKDTLVPVQLSEEMVAALRKSGAGDVRLTVYPDAGHDAWTETYDNPKLYEWLLQQQRRAAGAAAAR